MKAITAAEEFKKNPDLKVEDLNYLKDWISKQSYLPQNVPDETLILLLHSCYYSLEAAKQTIDQYFTLRTHIPEFFTKRNLNFEDVSEAAKTMYIIPLKGRSKEGYRILLCGLLRCEPHLFNFSDAMKGFNMAIDAYLRSDGTAPGLLLVLSFTGLKLGHIARLNISTMKKILVYLQEGMPVRLKGLHYINVVPFIDKVVALMKPFMKKELMDMLVIHGEESNTIYDIVPKELFPNELGGCAGEIQHLKENSLQLMRDSQAWFDEEEKLRIDETKRPGKAKSASELFGVEGSFRKLNID